MPELPALPVSSRPAVCCVSALRTYSPRAHARSTSRASASPLRAACAVLALSKTGLWQFPALARCVDWGYGNRDRSPTGRSSQHVAENGVVAARSLPQPQISQRDFAPDCHNPDSGDAAERGAHTAPRWGCHNPDSGNVAGRGTRPPLRRGCHNPGSGNVAGRGSLPEGGPPGRRPAEKSSRREEPQPDLPYSRPYASTGTTSQPSSMAVAAGSKDRSFFSSRDLCRARPSQ